MVVDTLSVEVKLFTMVVVVGTLRISVTVVAGVTVL
jgi:hypothetical protein